MTSSFARTTDARRLSTRIAVLALFPAMAGCVAEQDSSNHSPSTTASTSPTPSASSTPSAPRVSGIVALTVMPREGLWKVGTYDPSDGHKTRTLTLRTTRVVEERSSFTSAVGDDDPRPAAEQAAARAHFSTDWMFAALPGQDGIHIYRLDAASNRYTPWTRVTPPRSTVYDHPRFVRHGHRLWFEARPAEGRTKLVSVDYISPKTPRTEVTLPGTDDVAHPVAWRLLGDGTSGRARETKSYRLTLYGPDGKRAPRIRQGRLQLQYVTVDGRPANAALTVEAKEAFQSDKYDFVAALGDKTILMRQTTFTETYGPVIAVRIDPQHDDLTVTTVAKRVYTNDVGRPPADSGMALAPDERHVVLAANDWVVKRLSSTGAPKSSRVLRKAPDTRIGHTRAGHTRVIDWTR